MEEDYNGDFLIGDGQRHENSIRLGDGIEINFHKPDKQLDNVPERPNNHLLKSLIALCLFPFIGIFAVYKSWRVHDLHNKGDYEGAKMASRDADLLAKVGIGLVVVPTLLIVAAIIGYLIYLCFILFIYYE